MIVHHCKTGTLCDGPIAAAAKETRRQLDVTLKDTFVFARQEELVNDCCIAIRTSRRIPCGQGDVLLHVTFVVML